MLAQDPSAETFGAPPSEASRRGDLLRVCLALFVLVIVFHWLGRSSDPADERGMQRVMAADVAAKYALASRSAAGSLMAADPWDQVESQYRLALAQNPSLARARRGLAASQWLNGDVKSAKETMSGPARVPPGFEDAWSASKVAFGAAVRPRDAATLRRYRSALSKPELGWSGLIALKGLSDTRTESRRWDARIAREYGANRLTSLALFVGFGLLALGVGAVILVVYAAGGRREQMPAAPGSYGTLLKAFFVAFIVQYLPGFALGAVMGYQSFLERYSQSLGLSVVVASLSAVAAYSAANAIMRDGGADFGRLGWRVRGAAAWGVGGYLATLPLLALCIAVIVVLTVLFPNIETPGNPAAYLAASAHGWRLVFVFLLVCVMAPVIEEFLFRGLLFRSLETRFGFMPGAIISSCVFAGLHPQLPWGFLNLFAIGLAFCYLYRASGSLVPGMVAHGLNNAIALIGSLIFLARLR